MRLEVFYEQHKEELISILSRHWGDREAAADAVQESFLKALKNSSLLSGMQEKTLWSWLYTTAKNALIDEKRKLSRIHHTDAFDEPDPANDLIDTIFIGELLHKLPPNLIRIVSLRYYGNLNSTEIGALLGISSATVRSQLRSAMAMMRKYI